MQSEQGGEADAQAGEAAGAAQAGEAPDLGEGDPRFGEHLVDAAQQGLGRVRHGHRAAGEKLAAGAEGDADER